MKKLLILCLISVCLSTTAYTQTRITAKDASKHINEDVIVCDKVFSGKFFPSSSLTLLDIGGYHPNELLTLVIKGDDRKKFSSSPDELFKGKNVCITGKIIDFKGKPEIVITDAEQIKVQ